MKLMMPMAPLTTIKPGPAWCPKELGQPSASFGQNDDRFAFFLDRRWLAIQQAGEVSVYDTADHEIGGMSDSNGVMTFVSQKGVVTLDELEKA